MSNARPACLMLLAVALLGACGKPAPAPAPAGLARPLLAIPANGQRIAIPSALIVERNGIPGVFVLQDNTARFRMVRPGKIREGRVEILSGLLGSETLVAGDLREVVDGSAIAPVANEPSRGNR